MQWNIVPEYVSLLFVSILLVYSREYNLITTLKNRLFRLFLRFVFFEILVSIASIIAIENHQIIPDAANQAIQIAYFLAATLMVLLFIFYLIAVVWDGDPKVYTYFWIAAIPYILYSMLVLTNPVTGLLYGIGKSSGFTYGKGFFLTYAISIFYMLSIFLVVLIKRREIERLLKLILLSFPIISLIMIGIQWVFPTIVLTGSAATATLLIVYLYIQNKQIFLDDTTGLQNRKALLRMLELNVKRKSNMDIILISLDDFKAINDKFGQSNGDSFLISISQYLKSVVPIKRIYRYSGDEFIIVLDKSFHLPTAALVGNIRRRFGDLWNCGSIRSMLTASIATTRFPEHAGTREDIIMLLEFCIDLSKKTGKGKTIFSDASIVEEMKRKNQVIDLLKRGLAQDIFEMHYQPIYSIKENRFTTAEALLRISDSVMGAVSPAEFIPIAEETGLIVDIGYVALEKVCRFINELDEKGVKIDAISINLSSLQLVSEEFVDRLLEIISRNRIDPSKLRMELTESVLVNELEHTNNMIWKLSEAGIQLYLDDFGTGYSNIANIVKLPFSFIKIDRSILYEAIANKKCSYVLNGFSRTFSTIGMKVVIEGVETLDQRKLAEEINVDFIQGFIFARPMPASEVIQYLGEEPDN
jgi:diguanylate cyclase